MYMQEKNGMFVKNLRIIGPSWVVYFTEDIPRMVFKKTKTTNIFRRVTEIRRKLKMFVKEVETVEKEELIGNRFCSCFVVTFEPTTPLNLTNDPKLYQILLDGRVGSIEKVQATGEKYYKFQ